MTVTLNNSFPVEYAGNGTAVTFSYPWKISAATDLLVGFIVGGVYTLQGISTYTVANVGNNGGGSITFSVAPPIGTTIDLRTQTPETQPTEFANLGAYLPENTTNAMDRLTRVVQDLTRQALTFSVRAPDVEYTPWPTLPVAAARVNSTLIFDGNGLPAIGLPLTSALTQSTFNQFLTTSNYLSLIYSATSIENSLGIVPVQLQYPPGTVDRYGINASPGVTDMTAPIRTAVQQMAAGGAGVQFGPSTYLVTSTPMTFTNAMNGLVNVRGYPFQSVIVNQAPAGANPTINIKGCEYFIIQGLVITGRAGFSNVAIYSQKDGGGNASGAGVIRDVYMTPNGGGIHLQTTYEVTIDQCYYWPTGDPTPTYGGTIDTNGQPYGIWGDVSDGGQVNAIIIRDFRTSGLNLIAADGSAASIKIDGSGAGLPCVGWRIDGLIAERPGSRALWCRQANLLTATNLWVENAEVRIENNCRRCLFQSLDATGLGSVVVDGTQLLGGNAYITFDNSSANSFACDINNQVILETGNCIWTTYSNSALLSGRINTNAGSLAPLFFNGGGTAGFGTPTGNSVIANYPGASATLAQTTATVAEILTVLKNIGFITT